MPAIPQEMKQAAKCFGKEFLGEVPKEEILNHITLIRELAGDRAALRALHFVCENERVKKEVDALRKDNFPKFLANVKESGDSSFKYLQNVYTCHDVQHQNVSIALALSDVIFGEKGVCRVHEGGFRRNHTGICSKLFSSGLPEGDGYNLWKRFL